MAGVKEETMEAMGEATDKGEVNTSGDKAGATGSGAAPSKSAASDAAPSGAKAGSEKGASEVNASKGPEGDKNHTIVLVQTSKHDSTRFYFDCPTVSEAVEAVLRMYETRLKELNPGAKTINYDLASLTQYIDDLRDIHVMSWEPSISGYKRWDRKWIKAKLQEMLLKSAQPRKK